MIKRLLLLGIITVIAFLSPLNIRAASSVAGHKIVIDPGHGGSDFGSTACLSLYEKDANLEIALKLKDLLTTDGALVYMTREGNETLSNADRYNFANSVSGEALVSVHLNGSNNTNKNGTMGLYGKLRKDKAFTDTVHKKLASELEVPDLGITNYASGVLLKANMPATIQETVYISNTLECQLLSDGTGQRQQEIARSLHYGLVDWFSLK